ncbi:hypothetical protein PARMER_03489 [Parabacteroides merdae ATCC 43184]|nr:hypothetical protein PARMER_03489 [Parabacteroides merdae ATCC 43184]
MAACLREVSGSAGKVSCITLAVYVSDILCFFLRIFTIFAGNLSYTDKINE